MTEQSIEKSDIAVLTDREVGGADYDWEAADLRHWDVGEGVETALSAALVGDPKVVVVDGDDRFVSRVLTRVRRRRLRADEPALLPLATGTYHTVADHLGTPSGGTEVPSRIVDRLEAGNWRRQRVPTLRVTASVEPAPLWGFSFGAGLLFALFEAHQRSGGTGLSALGGTVGRIAREFAMSGREAFEAPSGRVSVDWRPWGDSVGFLVATGLSKTWLGLGPADGIEPKWMGGTEGRDLINSFARNRALPGFLGGTSGEAFERIHIDWSSGFVLDGRLHDPEGAYVLQVMAGAAAELVAV